MSKDFSGSSGGGVGGILGSIQEISDIQQEIENYTKKIEHEKINLRLVKERHQKQLNLYSELQNKRKPKILWEKGKKSYIEGNDKKEYAFNRDITLNKNELDTVNKALRLLFTFILFF